MKRLNTLRCLVAIILVLILTGLSAFSAAPTWTNAPTSPGGFMIACSADAKTFLVGDGDFVYTSTNSGITWSNQSSLANVQVVAVSANGGALYVSDSGNFTISTNGGVSWTHRTNHPSYSGNYNLQFIACSGDGSKLLVGTINSPTHGPGITPLFTSADFGNTWTSNTAAPVTNWQSAAMSADGTKIAAATYSGKIYTSTNSGASWNLVLSTNRNWASIASSVDGTKLIAGPTFSGVGGIFTSGDSGAHWQIASNTGGYGWPSVASSADGTRLVAVSDSGPIVSSTNSGATWITNNAPSIHWGTVCTSADGIRNFASPNPEYAAPSIYRTITGAQLRPAMTVKFTNGNLVLSWPVPSTNFALQSCPDLKLTNWQNVATNPTLNGTNLHSQVSLSPTNSAAFFRLVTQ